MSALRSMATVTVIGLLFVGCSDGITDETPPTGRPAVVRYVDATNGSDQGGTNACEDMNFPCSTIAHAIERSFGGDTVRVSDGVYTERLVIGKSLNLMGESSAGTIIQAATEPRSGSGRVITIDAEIDVEIASLTIRHGDALDEEGGGLYVHDARVVLTDVDIKQNHAQYGAGMYLRGSATLTDVDFRTNRAEISGGGLAIRQHYGANVVLTRVHFGYNVAARSSGGGLDIYSVNAVIEDVTFTENSAGSDSYEFGGGGMSIVDASPSITEATFDANDSRSAGGGLYVFGGDPKLTNVKFVKNAADQWGGGMYVEDGSPILTNVVFHDNTSESGGGMYNYVDASPLLTNVTFSRNVATIDGGAMRNAGGSSPTLHNSIVWGNAALGTGHQIANHAAATVTLRYSLYGDAVGDIVEGGGVVAENCLTESPRFINAAERDLRLMTGSHAINAGDPDTVEDIFPSAGDGSPLDLDGADRVVGGRIDIGAYEHQGT